MLREVRAQEAAQAGKPATTDDRIRSLVIQGEYYATIAYLPDLRRVQITWMRKSGFYSGMPFNQQMTVPSELSLHTAEDGQRLRMLPVVELASLRTRTHERSDVPLNVRTTRLSQSPPTCSTEPPSRSTPTTVASTYPASCSRKTTTAR